MFSKESIKSYKYEFRQTEATDSKLRFTYICKRRSRRLFVFSLAVFTHHLPGFVHVLLQDGVPVRAAKSPDAKAGRL